MDNAPEKPKRKRWGRPFQPGQSGNPSGRKRRYSKTVTALAREASPKAIKTLIEIMEDPAATPGVRATCCEKILDRAWGKPLATTALAVGVGRLSDLSDEQLLAILAGDDSETP